MLVGALEFILKLFALCYITQNQLHLAALVLAVYASCVTFYVKRRVVPSVYPELEAGYYFPFRQLGKQVFLYTVQVLVVYEIISSTPADGLPLCLV